MSIRPTRGDEADKEVSADPHWGSLTPSQPCRIATSERNSRVGGEMQSRFRGSLAVAPDTVCVLKDSLHVAMQAEARARLSSLEAPCRSCPTQGDPCTNCGHSLDAPSCKGPSSDNVTALHLLW
jgi:hypothetical protein